MVLPFRRWLHLPSRVALLLGLGALSTAGAQANIGGEISRDAGPVSGTERSGCAGLSLSIQGGRLYVSEDGRSTEELRLRNTEEARRLLNMLEQIGARNGVPSVSLDRMLLAGGGGNGISWARVPKTTAPSKPLPVDAIPKRPSSSKPTGAAPRTSNPTGKTASTPPSSG